MAAQVLVRLGGHLNQVRQQVLQRLHGFQGEDEPGSIRAVQQPVLLSRIDAVERRLSILEQRVGTRPDLRELDRELAQVRRDKKAAIEAQDFEKTAALGDRVHVPPGTRTVEETGNLIAGTLATVPGLTGTAVRAAAEAVNRTAGAVSAARSFLDDLRGHR